jgi:agmatine/peptidylarginine deiminase
MRRERFAWILALLLVVVGVASAASAQEAKRVPREYLERIADDDPDPLPRNLTEAERALPLPLPSPWLELAPPTGTVWTPPEYAANQGLLIRWGSFNAVLTEMVVGITTGDPDAIVYIVVTDGSQQASATAALQGAGADLGQVEFITYTTNTVWMRDYGPRFIAEDGQRAIVDHTYNRPRPLDDAFPDFLSSLWGEPQYDLPLVHGGGNFHLFGDVEAFMTELILDENPGVTEQEVVDLFAAYEGLALDITDGFPSWYDSTRHIDMWMLPVRDREVIIGQYAPADGEPYAITEAMTAELSARGYTVHRTPGWSAGGTHYTYTNAVVFNGLVFVSEFAGYPSQNAAAIAVFEAAFPDHQVIPVDCSDIIHYAGAIHCIVMHVPVVLGVPGLPFADGFESGDLSQWSSFVP